MNIDCDKSFQEPMSETAEVFCPYNGNNHRNRRVKHRRVNEYPLKKWKRFAKEEWESIDDVEYVEIIEEQIIVKAKDIDCSNFDIATFPWHGYTKEDFSKLNRKLQIALRSIWKLDSAAKIIRFKRKNSEIYSAYFRSPIRVKRMDDGTYLLWGDGRHRVEIAKQTGGEIPIWVVSEVQKNQISLEKYLRFNSYGEWRFIKQ